MLEEFSFSLSNLPSSFTFFIPLGVVGAWRWSVWFVKVLIGLAYQPIRTPHQATVSVVTPVYNERPDVFRAALASWAANAPDEIIAVIDDTDTSSIEAFRQFATEFPTARLIITETPGKRPALADGIRAATSDIVALVDGDTIWEKSLLPEVVAPFANPRVGGVATTQRVLAPRTFAQRIFDILLSQRYFVEMPFLATVGSVLRCLSGRTAVYRRDTVLPLLDDLVHETFWGKPVISGEDKRLTYLVQAAGWQTVYQRDARVYTPGAEDLATFMKQRLRWARNSWRADLRALTQRWTWRRPLFALFLIDSALQPFAVLLGSAYFVLFLFRGALVPVAILMLWWCVSRFVRLAPVLAERPGYTLMIPEYVLMNIIFALTKIYALFTLNTQGWITRWDRSRLPAVPILHAVWASGGTMFVWLGLVTFALTVQPRSIVHALGIQVLPANLTYIKHLVPRERSIPVPDGGLSERGVPAVLASTTFQSGSPPPGPAVTYDARHGTITLRGRGQRYTLARIRSALRPELGALVEIAPRQWYLKANIRIQDGATLELLKEEVEWLRLASSERRFVWIRADDSTIVIRGAKVTSWDERTQAPDTHPADGRSSISARNGSRLDVLDAEVAYLGYVPALTGMRGDAPFGLTWKVTDGTPQESSRQPTGSVVGSRIHHNAYGVYARGAVGLSVRGSAFVANDQYGVVLHAGTRGALLEGNWVSNNGRSGIIVVDGARNTLRQNTVTGHRLHGVVLQNAHGNSVEANTIVGAVNTLVLQEADRNRILGNTLRGGKGGIELGVGSQHNRIEGNTLETLTGHGVLVQDSADRNTVRANTFRGNSRAVVVASRENDVFENHITQGDVGITLEGRASGNSLFANDIRRQATYGLVIRTASDNRNFLGPNTFAGNQRGDIGSVSWR